MSIGLFFYIVMFSNFVSGMIFVFKYFKFASCDLV